MMTIMQVEWDQDKDRDNQQKHGVTFAEATRVFDSDGQCLEFYDEAHSDFEERFITIGPIPPGLVLVVWTEREPDTVRIISPRWANLSERTLYRSHMETLR